MCSSGPDTAVGATFAARDAAVGACGDADAPRRVEVAPVASRWGRAAPVATGAALAGAAIAVAVHDPSSPGSRFPACAFHAATGLWCPGCGLTRATHHLLTGDPLAALSSNLFAPFVLLAIVTAWLAWTTSAFGRPVANPLTRIPARAAVAIGVLVVAYGVLRNVPGDPWQALAP